MPTNFKKNTFKKRLSTMMGVDFRRMFTSPLFYLMIGISLVVPILILVMVTMLEGSVSVNPQTGEETIMEGFKTVWEIIGTSSSAASDPSAGMAMSITSMCNINMMFFAIAVFVCIFVSDDFRSGYAKNLFTAVPPVQFRNFPKVPPSRKLPSSIRKNSSTATARPKQKQPSMFLTHVRNADFTPA